MKTRRGVRPSSPRPRARWRAAAFYAALAGEFLAAAAFAFCVIAPAYGFHTAMAKPGAAVSLAVMVACIAVVRLTGDDE